MKNEVIILGTKYKIRELNKEESPELENYLGWCDGNAKEIILDKSLNEKNLLTFKKKVLRHEIIHAFIRESGLRENSLVYDNGWATNEEMVDWFAFQSPKIFKVFKELSILGDEE